MLRNLKIGTRLAAGFGGLVAITVLIMALFYLANANRLAEQAEKRELQGFYGATQAQLQTQSFFAEAMSAVVANQPLVKTLFAEGDRQALAAQFKPVFDQLKATA